jgi:putative endonuclease
MSNSGRNLGVWGENIAAKFLVDKGYIIYGRNCRTPYGEIDIVALKLDIVFFVEVKTRRNLSFGMPEDAVNAIKREKLIHSAEEYLLTHPELGGGWQIDVIAIHCYKPNSFEIIHFENAINDYE